MTVLGLDFGERRIGVSLGRGGLAAPLVTITYRHPREAVERIKEVCREQQVDLLVLGLPYNRQGKSGYAAKKVKDFGSKLVAQLKGLKLVYFDETLSTVLAREDMRRCGLGKKRIRAKEDAFAAAALLQRYLDEKKEAGSPTPDANNQ